MRKPKVVVVGSSNTDMVIKVPRIPVQGETILGSDFMIIPGGKGANQAVAAARAGAEVVFIACVSDDAFGREAIENYRKEGVDTSYIKIQTGTYSGIALINVSEDGENCISVAPGANQYLSSEDLYGLEGVFMDAKIVLAQLEIPLNTVIAAGTIAKRNGIPFILNPAPGASIPENLLSIVDYITPNETEIAIITSRKKFSSNDIQRMAMEIFEKYGTKVITTLGSNGVYIKTHDFEGNIPGYKVDVIDTTAAGDVFNGALALALAKELKLIDAVDFAQRAAAISVTKIGAQPSAPTMIEIQNYNFRSYEPE